MTSTATGADGWSITHGSQVVAIDQVGGGIRSYDVDGEAVLDSYPPATRAPGGAGQVLAPWPNRVRDGRYEFDGRPHALALTEPEHGNAIHGLVRGRPWRLTGQTASSVTVVCTIEDEPGYPFRIRLSTTWSLSDDGLEVEHTAENLGTTTAPFGLGVHPYLVIPGTAVDELTLTIPAERVLVTDERGLPVTQIAVAQSDVDFRAGGRIGARRLDHAFTTVTGDHTVRVSDGNTVVELWLGDGFSWTQVFTGDTLAGSRRRRAVAVEPMTCPADAFNSGTDLVRLEPGRLWSARWGLRVVKRPGPRRDSTA